MSGKAWQTWCFSCLLPSSGVCAHGSGTQCGPALQRRPAAMADVVDATERYLRRAGSRSAPCRRQLHGRSLWRSSWPGAWSRGNCVCVFSGRFLVRRGRFRARAFNRLQRGVALGRLARPILPLMYKSATVRRLVLRDVACHGDESLQPRPWRSSTMASDAQSSPTSVPPIGRSRGWTRRHARSPSVWGEKETFLPPEAHGKIQRIPQASIKTLSDVGHVPMVDDPDLVARTILTTTGAGLEQK